MTPAIRSLALTCFLVLPGAAAQADVVDRVISRLQAEGYSAVTISRTLLGRARIVGRGSSGAREIVIDRRTGEVLRDWRRDDDDGGRNRGRDDDRDDDDDNDKGGGGNSGSGGGNASDDDDDD